jgi:hypothetical protein
MCREIVNRIKQIDMRMCVWGHEVLGSVSEARYLILFFQFCVLLFFLPHESINSFCLTEWSPKKDSVVQTKVLEINLGLAWVTCPIVGIDFG